MAKKVKDDIFEGFSEDDLDDSNNGDGLFDDFSEDDIFGDFSEDDLKEPVQDQPSTPVVGKKKEDTVSESESQQEGISLDSSSQESVWTEPKGRASESKPSVRDVEVKGLESLYVEPAKEVKSFIDEKLQGVDILKEGSESFKESLYNELPLDISDSFNQGILNSIIESKKEQQVESISKDYIDSYLSNIKSEYSSLPISKKALDKKAISEMNKDFAKKSLLSLDLDEDESKEFSEAILKFNEYMNLSKEERDNKIDEGKKWADKIAELREDPNRQFINPATGEVDEKKKEDVEKRTASFVSEYKNDFQKMSDRLKSEIAKKEALEVYLANKEKPFFEGMSEEGLLNSAKAALDPDRATTSLGSFLSPDDKVADYVSEDNLDLAERLRTYYKEADYNTQALSRAILLNENPAAVSRGFSFMDGSVGQFISSFGEGFAEAATGDELMTDNDFAKIVADQANKAGVELTPEQYERAKTTTGEKYGEMFGMSTEIMAEMIITTAATEGTMTALKVPQLLSKMSALKNSPKLAKLVDYTYSATKQGISFALTDEGTFGMGVGEFVAGNAAERALDLISKGKAGKFLKIFSKVVGSGVGGTIEEYAGEFVDQGIENGFFSKKQFENTFGRDFDEAMDKMLATAILSFTLGSGAEVGKVLYDSKAYYENLGDTERAGEIQKLIEANKAKEEAAKGVTKEDINDLVEQEVISQEEADDIISAKEESTVIVDDTKEEQQVPSDIEEGQESGSVQEQESSQEKTETSGVLREEEQERLNELKAKLKEKEDQIADDFNKSPSGEINQTLSKEAEEIRDQISEIESRLTTEAEQDVGVIDQGETEVVAETDQGVKVEEDLDAPEVVSELTEDQKKVNSLARLVKDYNESRNGSKSQREIGQRIQTEASKLGLTVSMNKGKISVLKENGKPIQDRGPKTRYKTQPEQDINNVKKAVRLGYLDTDAKSNSGTDLPGITNSEAIKGTNDILNGKENTENAKKVAIAFRKALKQGGFGIYQKLGRSGKGNIQQVSLEGFQEATPEFEELTKSEQEEVMKAEAESDVPQVIKDLSALPIDEYNEAISDFESKAVDNIGETVGDSESVEELSEDQAKKVLADVQEALGATDEEIEQLAQVLNEKRKQKEDGKKEQREGVSATETTTENVEEAEQTAEQIDASKRNKSFLNRVLNDPKTSESHKEMLSDIDKKYTQESNEWQSDQADILIDTFDKGGRLDDLWIEVSDLNNDMSFGVRAMLALKMKRLYDEKSMFRKSASVSEWIDKTARKFGQFNQALIDRGSPESVLSSKKKDWEEKAKKKYKKDSKSGSGKTVNDDIADASEELNEEAKRVAEEISEDVNLEKAVEKAKAEQKLKEIKESNKENQKQKRKGKIQKERDLRKKLKKELKDSKKKYFNSSIGGFTSEGIELASKIAASYIREGVTRLDALAKKLRDFFSSELDVDLTDDQVRQILNHKVDGKDSFELIQEEKTEQAKVKLSKRVLNAVSNTKKPKVALDAVDTVLKELTLKAKQNLPSKKPNESSEKYTERVLEAMSLKDLSKDVWEGAVDAVLDKLDLDVENGKITDAEKAEILDKLQGFFGDFVGKPFADSVLDKAISEQLKSMDVKIRDIIKQHWTNKADVANSLASKFVSQANLSPELAQELESEVLKMFSKKIQESADKALTKILGTSPLKLKSKRKTDTQKLIEAYNLGALNSDMYKSLFAEKFGLVSLSNADETAIGKFIHDLNLYPEGSEALHRGMAEFNDYLKGLEPDSYKLKSLLEFLTEVFYTNVLSGFSTLARGAKGVAMTAGAEIMVEAFKNPRLAFTTNQGISALWRGFNRGRKEFMSIMKDGYVPISKNLDNTTGSLDKIQNSKWSDLGYGGKANKVFFYLPVKMLRALIATDALAHYTSREFFATTKAYNEVLREGMHRKDVDFWKSVEDRLHISKADQNLARQQALEEQQKIIDKGGSLKNFDLDRRSREILDGMRSDDIQQFSEDKADKARLGQTPQGILGYIYEKTTEASANITGLNRIVPFLKIPTNAMDMWLDYTPWGYKRAAFGKSSLALIRASSKTKERLKVGRSNMTPDQRIDHMIKATIGTASLAMIAGSVLSQMDMDDDDPNKWFSISYKGFGSFRDNEGLRQSGWKEMSFRFKNPFTGEWTEWFDYRDSPMAMVFSTIGSIHDERKYKRAGESDVQTKDLVSSGLVSSLLFVSEQNYTKSLMNLSNVFSREGSLPSNAKNFSGDYIKKNIQSVFYPNIYKQSYQTYKALVQKNERFVTRYSDNWTKGVKENLLKDIPYIEDKLGKEAFDQLGYPITRRIDDVPLIPEFVLDGMQTILSERTDYNEKPAWELFNKHNFTIGWNGSRTFEGRDLTTDEQLDLKKLTADKIREVLEDPKEFDYLYNLTRQEFVEEIQSLKSQASEDAKYELFGNQ